VLKIIVTETEAGTRWILQGKLVGPWVRELRSCWKKWHRTQGCVVDLNEVTFIDKSGERLLRAISKNGAQFVAGGIYTKYVVDMLKMEVNAVKSRHPDVQLSTPVGARAAGNNSSAAGVKGKEHCDVVQSPSRRRH